MSVSVHDLPITITAPTHANTAVRRTFEVTASEGDTSPALNYSHQKVQKIISFSPVLGDYFCD
jgi:hypothetical protein